MDWFCGVARADILAVVFARALRNPRIEAILVSTLQAGLPNCDVLVRFSAYQTVQPAQQLSMLISYFFWGRIRKDVLAVAVGMFYVSM